MTKPFMTTLGKGECETMINNNGFFPMSEKPIPATTNDPNKPVRAPSQIRDPYWSKENIGKE